MYLNRVFSSIYCRTVFLTGIGLGYMVVPEKIFTGLYYVLGAAFILVFATTITCTVRNTRERIKLEKTAGSSTLAAVSAGIGISALNVCGVGAPVCTATAGAGLISVIPGIASSFFRQYAVHITVITLLIQILALHLMNCFRQS